MVNVLRRAVLTLALFSLVPGLGLAGGTEWPHLRGPGFDGEVAGTELFARGETGLSLAWRVPLGSGYSGISIAGGRAVTFYSDGETDWVVAMDARSGSELWRHRIDATNQGRDGSDDGPLSTPIIQDDVVYGLGPNGQLFALRLADGGQVWARALPEDFGSRIPHFGFGTTPLVSGNVLVVQTGGAGGRSVSGIDRRNGKTLWTVGDAEVEYQSPAILRLAGRDQVVAVGGHQVSGIDPATGKLLWEQALGEEDRVGGASPTTAGESRFLIITGPAAAVYQVDRNGDEYAVSEVYRTQAFGNTYALPVLHEGHLYGFKRQFLTCADAGTGEIVWKSRPPGGRGLILIDGHLVIFAAKGAIVLAKATPEGYAEEARLQAMEGSGYTWPSFAGDKIFVRNLTEMAAINLTAGPAVSLGKAEPEPAAAPGSGTAFARFVDRVEAAPDKQALVETFLKENERFPLVEGEYVHFVYSGDAEDVALAGNMLETGSADPLERIPGTDLYHRTYRFDPGTRWEYRFVVNYDDRVLDPRNPSSVPARWDDIGWSELVLPGREVPTHMEEPSGGKRGTIETATFASEILGNEREVSIYLPPGYGDSEAAYPLLVVQELDYLEKGLMANTLDNLIGTRVAPVVVAFVAPQSQWWLEAGGTGTQDYTRMLATEFVPYLARKYRLIDSPEARALMGKEGFGLSAAYAALKYPDVFGNVAIQSVSLQLGAEDDLMGLIAGGTRKSVRVYMDWNRYESHSTDSAYDLRQDSERLAGALKAKGYSYTGGEVIDAYGWGSWRARSDRILVALFPIN
jgi:enterochelin esterase-like enzyme/outer membrane protein assembly factor BamB